MITFESLDLNVHFLCTYSFRIIRSSSYNKVIGSTAMSQEQKSFIDIKLLCSCSR